MNQDPNALAPEVLELMNRAMAAASRADWNAASRLLQEAITHKPDLVEAHHNLARIRKLQGDIDGAIAVYQQVLSIKPDFSPAMIGLAGACHEAGRVDDAIAIGQRAIALVPSSPEAHFNLGCALQAKGNNTGAIEQYERAIALKPDYAKAHNNLGTAYQGRQRFDEAISSYQKALSIQPHAPDTLHNLGKTYETMGEMDAAAAHYLRALTSRPDFAEAYNSLGSLRYHQGLFSEAEKLLNRAIAIEPNHASARLNLALLHLIQGDFERGWKEYEARWDAQKLSPTAGFPQPRWDGSPLDGQRILLHVEQGLGDAIQFIRFVPQVQGLGGRVIVRCWSELKRLFTGQLGIGYVFDENDPVPEFDVHLPLISVARVLGVTLPAIPADVPYLRVETSLTEPWRQKVRDSGGKFNVGVVWSGNPKHSRDQHRSIPLSAFEPLFRLPGVRFHSLQKDQPAAQFREFQIRNPQSAISNVPDLSDLADTAALITNLDLVISVDTSVAHLAGALGKPVWVLLPFIPDWRWMLDRSDSPWYPSMRLFRQSRSGDWEGPIHRISEALRSLLQ